MTTTPESSGVSAEAERTRDEGGAADPERRRFFRSFAGEAMSAAASIAGAVGVLQREAASARDDLLGAGGEPGTAIQSTPNVRTRPPGEGRAGRAAPNDRWAAAVVAENDPSGTFRSPYRWVDGRMLLVDQRRLPDELVEVACDSGADVAAAIRDMVIRGAPAIGQAAAYGVALTAAHERDAGPQERDAAIKRTADGLRAARPTAVDLGWALDRMLARYRAVGATEASGDVIADALLAEADAIATDAMLEQAELARHGATLMPGTGDSPLRILTHCNTGPLAAGQVGTALGVVQRLHADGRPLHVWVDESRPYLQGARLTAWELGRAGVPHAVIADAAAGSLMARGQVDAIVVGADRVAANGDTANKIGTYPLAVLAARHGVPFIVAAPTSSIDLDTPDGAAIPIEERAESEVTTLRGVRIAPEDSPAYNPAFDVTPAELMTAIVTEHGPVHPPFAEGLAAAVAAADARRRRSVPTAA
jgi:methylthioribose-1-phosphate isomerase